MNVAEIEPFTVDKHGLRIVAEQEIEVSSPALDEVNGEEAQR